MILLDEGIDRYFGVRLGTNQNLLSEKDLGLNQINLNHRGKMMQKMKAESLAAALVKTAVRLGLAPVRNRWHTATVE